MDSSYACAAEIVIWKTGWYNGLPAVIRAVGVSETQIVLDNGTIAETAGRGIKGLGALRKLPGWSEVAPVAVEPVAVAEITVEPIAEVVTVEQEPVGVQVAAIVAPEPPKFNAPAVPDVSMLTTISDVARAIADEVAGLARAEVISALKVRAGEIALGGVRVRVPKAEVVRAPAVPASPSRSEKLTLYAERLADLLAGSEDVTLSGDSFTEERGFPLTARNGVWWRPGDDRFGRRVATHLGYEVTLRGTTVTFRRMQAQ